MISSQQTISPLSRRFLAAIINAAILVFPIFNISVFFKLSFNSWLTYSAFYASLVFLVQSYLLTIRGQSIGKILLKIKIINFKTRGESGFFRNVFLREIVFRLISIASCGVAGVVNIFFLVFNENHRALHDKLAGTVVINSNAGDVNTAFTLDIDLVKKKYSNSAKKISAFVRKYFPIIIASIIAFIPFYPLSWPVEALSYRISGMCHPQYITCFQYQWLQKIFGYLLDHISFFGVHFLIFITLGVISQICWLVILRSFRPKS